jgi:hypothetical protein
MKPVEPMEPLKLIKPTKPSKHPKPPKPFPHPLTGTSLYRERPIGQPIRSKGDQERYSHQSTRRH